jgi:hypothetical protein
MFTEAALATQPFFYRTVSAKSQTGLTCTSIVFSMIMEILVEIPIRL